MEDGIDDARARVAALKAQIKALQAEKSDGTMKDACEASGGALKGLLRLTKPTCRRKLCCGFGHVYAMHWAVNDGAEHKLISAQSGTLTIWNAMAAHKLQTIPCPGWPMTCAFEPKVGAMVACGDLSGLCSIYRVNPTSSRRQQRVVVCASKELDHHDGYLSCCRFIDEQRIVTCGGDSLCILWDVERAAPTHVFQEHSSDVMSVSLSPMDENQFISGSCDALTKVWDLRQPKAAMSFKGHESDINSVAYMPDGHSFVTGSDDGTCRLFDMRAYAQLNCFDSKSIDCDITSVAASKSGRLLFAVCDDHNVCCACVLASLRPCVRVAVRAHSRPSPLPHHPPTFLPLLLSLEQCCVWDTLDEGLKPIHELIASDSRVTCVGVNATGQALCTGSRDSRLKVWA